MSDLLAKVAAIGAEVAAKAADDVDRNARFPIEAIDALKKARALSAQIPVEYGGLGLGLGELAAMCEALGQHCSATGMVFAMHQIKMATFVRHGLGPPSMQAWARRLVETQGLLASVTSEVGVGGDVRQSKCAVERDGDRFTLKKRATTVSYGLHADALLITTRRAPDAAPNDQVLVVAHRENTKLVQTGAWDTLGMRGTCSPAFDIETSGHVDQIIDDFATISTHTMVPFSHVLWAHLWLGIATGAVSRARASVRAAARAKPGTTPPQALRLAEVAANLHALRATVHEAAITTTAILRGEDGGTETLSSIGFALKMNNLKIVASQQIVAIVHQAMLIAGIAGYRNDSKFAIGRYLRDAHSAALMIGNDRVFATNASLLLVLKED